ncbi:MAG TPA: SMC-Scp complex subunit ScpB [Bdellovibrionota bacterium]|nr:SMC-Scp complex subunit ScpB [Bdellovibrionota bacterium]
MNISSERLKSILESLLFLSDKPLHLTQLAQTVTDASEAEIKDVLDQLKADRSAESSGIDLVEVAGGYQLRTKATNSPWIFLLNKAKTVRLSRAALETLAIVAYRQPVTRPEIDDVRGVDCGPVLRHLLERNLVRILGKREEPGSPLIYGTTKEFLEFFSLRNLTDLPTLREYTELGQESLAKLEELLPKPDAQETNLEGDLPMTEAKSNDIEFPRSS